MYQRNFLLFIVLLSAISSQAQQALPRGAKMNFEVMYPSQKATWNQDTAGWWQAKFKLNSNVAYARYDVKGHWMNTMEDMSVDALPEGLKQSIKENWGLKIVGAKKGSTPYYTEVYELVLLKDNKPFSRLFNPEGLIVR